MLTKENVGHIKKLLSTIEILSLWVTHCLCYLHLALEAISTAAVLIQGVMKHKNLDL